MFPYTGILADVPAFNCYSQADIREINKLAEKSRLEVIPLIQTFGHLEFLLKLKQHSKLRLIYTWCKFEVGLFFAIFQGSLSVSSSNLSLPQQDIPTFDCHGRPGSPATSPLKKAAYWL